MRILEVICARYPRIRPITLKQHKSMDAFGACEYILLHVLMIQNLGLANFDPEFYKEYEEDVVRLYNQQTGENLALRQKRGLNSVLRFLR